MNFQTFLLIGVFIELCCVPSSEAKRSFGITRSRNKNKGPSVRRNQHGHDFEDNPVPAVHPKPDLKRPISHSNAPPPYPGLGGSAPYHGSYGPPPPYSPGFNQPRPGMFNQPGGFGGPYAGAMPMGGMGGSPMGGMGMPMGVMPMGGSMMGGGYGRSSGFGSGIMTNLFAGLAGYQLAKAFSGGHHQRDREVIVIDNRQPIANPAENPNIAQVPLNQPPETQTNADVATESPQIPIVGPAMNEYNYYGLPQYGLPLYGYSLPSQITDYYQTAVVKLPQEPISEK